MLTTTLRKILKTARRKDIVESYLQCSLSPEMYYEDMDGYTGFYIKEFSKKYDVDALIRLDEVKHMSIDDVLWLAAYTSSIDYSQVKKLCASVAVYAAELVLPNFESRFPQDHRPRKAIEAAKKYLKTGLSKGANEASKGAKEAAEFAILVHSEEKHENKALSSAAYAARWAAMTAAEGHLFHNPINNASLSASHASHYVCRSKTRNYLHTLLENYSN